MGSRSAIGDATGEGREAQGTDTLAKGLGAVSVGAVHALIKKQALRARLASNAEALAKARVRIHDLTVALDQQDEAVAGYRDQAEAAEGRIAELERDYALMKECSDENAAKGKAAEAALAECRAALQEISDMPGAVGMPIESEEAHSLGLAIENAKSIAARALAKEAPRHE
jgi:chromosome segregation ATPase